VDNYRPLRNTLNHDGVKIYSKRLRELPQFPSVSPPFPYIQFRFPYNFLLLASELYKRTRSSADADKSARRVYRSVKVTKQSRPTIPYVSYTFLLCNSNFVFKTNWYSTSQNVVTLKSGQRSLKVIESGTIDCVCVLVFYRNTVPNMHRLWDIRLRMPWP